LGTVANAAAGRGRNSLKRPCGVFFFSKNGSAFCALPSSKKQPAISGRKNGVPLAVKKYAVRSIFSARNRQPAR
jgi:hypothetical protein